MGIHMSKENDVNYGREGTFIELCVDFLSLLIDFMNKEKN